jgi:transcriptional regulator with XRE-family HTH domain
MNVIENIKKIRQEKGLTQLDIALALDFDQSNWNKIENGSQQLKVNHLEKIAQVLGVEVIDLFTYPKKYVDSSTIENYERISVTFEISPDKRDVLLKLVTGNDNIKIVDI